jgi:hypothetical protein
MTEGRKLPKVEKTEHGKWPKVKKGLKLEHK